MNDKNFMYEVFTHIPDSMMQEGAAEKAVPDAQGQMGKMFGWYCWPGAQAMGCSFTEAELMAECDRQFKALGGFKKIKFGAGMIKTLGKAKPKK